MFQVLYSTVVNLQSFSRSATYRTKFKQGPLQSTKFISPTLFLETFLSLPCLNELPAPKLTILHFSWQGVPLTSPISEE